MIKKTNWNYRSKYFLSGMILASILLLSSFSILTHNAFANAMINSVQTNDHSNTSTNAQSNSNIKNTDSTGANSKPAHVKSPPHIPPLILEQFMESKICKSKCIHPKSP